MTTSGGRGDLRKGDNHDAAPAARGPVAGRGRSERRLLLPQAGPGRVAVLPAGRDPAPRRCRGRPAASPAADVRLPAARVYRGRSFHKVTEDRGQRTATKRIASTRCPLSSVT